MDVEFEGGGETEITVDSGAEENACPWNWRDHFGIQSADRWMNFRGAGGDVIQHYGKASGWGRPGWNFRSLMLSMGLWILITFGAMILSRIITLRRFVVLIVVQLVIK